MRIDKSKQLIFTRLKHNGFALPIVVIIGFILSIGGFTLLASSFSGLHSSIRQSHSRQSRELAETGIAKTIERLNREYNYLLINCYSRSGSLPSSNNCTNTGTWNKPNLPSSICPDAASLENNISLEETVDLLGGRYRVEYYAYSGTQFYGGTGKLKVVGERLSEDKSRVLSTSAVELAFDVKPKPCDARFGDPATSSGFPGLLAKEIELNNNDVEGETSGNVLCTDCRTDVSPREAIGAKRKGIVDGNIYIGGIDLPSVPTYPNNLKPIKNPLEIDKESLTIKGGDPSTYQNTCQSDGIITHCVISEIDLSGRGDLLTLDTTDEPIRIYVSGDINIRGRNSGIKHIRSGAVAEDKDFARIGLFGVPESSCTGADPGVDPEEQDLKIAGINGDFTKLFAYMPCAEAEIRGGAGGPAIIGVLWAWEYDGSSSNVARLRVPDNAGSILFESIGAEFSLSIRDYVALGVKSWRSFEGLTQ